MHPVPSRSEAQQSADRIQLLREQLAMPDVQQVLALSPDQQTRFEEWALSELARLSRRYDVDTSVSQKRASWGMRIASTLGAIAICAAVVLFFIRYWGVLVTPLQVAILVIVPLIALCGAEFAATRERVPYFTGLLALVAFSSFVMNLAVLGSIFNINSTERALLAWSGFALAVAYRYRLRLLLALGLLLLIAYVAATVNATFGYWWLDLGERPEFVALLAVLVFSEPFVATHKNLPDFPPVYRVVGGIVFFVSLISLAEWGVPSYLPFSEQNIERLYEFMGLLASAACIWLGISRQWSGLVNVSATAFVVFLFTRLYHWWWDWMPRYLFFGAIGALGIALVLIFKGLRGRMAGAES
jgi:uncharacterized membrane protein